MKKQYSHPEAERFQICYEDNFLESLGSGSTGENLNDVIDTVGWDWIF